MAYDNLPRSRAAARTTKKDPILGVGCHAFVNWPHTTQAVPLVIAPGELPVPNDLIDGQEVEIVSWRPRSREGLAYQIRRLSDGREWWILAVHLRRERELERGVANADRLHAVRLPEHG
jgi:hypothetical protein